MILTEGEKYYLVHIELNRANKICSYKSKAITPRELEITAIYRIRNGKTSVFNILFEDNISVVVSEIDTEGTFMISRYKDYYIADNIQAANAARSIRIANLIDEVTSNFEKDIKYLEKKLNE